MDKDRKKRAFSASLTHLFMRLAESMYIDYLFRLIRYIIIQITDDEIVVIENISVETSDNGRAVRRVRYHLVETEIFSINNHFRVGY